MARKANAGISPSSASTTIAARNSAIVPRYGRANVHARRSEPRWTLASRTAARSRGYIECGPACMRRGYGRPTDFYDAPVLGRRALVLVTAAVLAITGCSAGGGVGQGPSFDNTTVPNSSAEVAVATIHWGKTHDGVQHGTIEVAADPDDPGAGTFTLALARHLATDRDERIGSLLVNPGGPGASGLVLAEQAPSIFGDELLRRFDIVAFDPRGTGSGTPAIQCTDDEDAVFGVDQTPDDPAQEAALTDSSKSFVDGCERRSGDLLAVVSTADAARDMDTIRQALGEETISYFGFSYGSELGATWATMFPATVRAAVLDGAVDPTLGYRQRQLDQAAGFEATLDTFLDACNANPECAFHNGGHADTAFDALAAQVEESP